MGSVMGLFRRGELDTAAQLEELEKILKKQSERKNRAMVRKHNIINRCWYYGGAIFAVLLVALYLTFPSDVRTEILKTFYLTSGVFLVYPVTFLIIRKIFRIYYDRQLKSAEDIIKQTRVEKKEILETVMEKEPYNKAKEILKKYDPSLLKSEEQKKEEEEHLKTQEATLRRRNVSPQNEQSIPANRQVRHSTPKNLNATLPVNQATPVHHAQFSSPQFARKRPQTARPLPGDVSQKSKMDKIVGWVTGSNPEQMYALICKNCCEHNGLSVKEEFDFLEWRCAYCHYLHKARKERPMAPRLPQQRPTEVPVERPSSISSSSNSRNSSPKVNRARISSISSRSSTSSNPIIEAPVKEDSGTESDQKEKESEEVGENIFINESREVIMESDEENLDETIEKESGDEKNSGNETKSGDEEDLEGETEKSEL